MGLYDVVIAGAGPAGLACAHSLSGLKILVIEKKREPYKRISCGEWVPPSFECPKYVSFINTESMRTIYPYGEIVSNFKGKIIDRNRWQEGLMNELKCEIHTGEEVLRVNKNLVITNKGEYRTEWIIGADGPISVVSKFLGCENRRFLSGVNLKIETKKYFNETIVYFDEDIRYGYAWCFPRGDISNVGIGMIGDIRKPLFRWMDFLKKNDIIKERIIQWSSGLIPVSGFSKILKDNMVLTGDAGGFVDPITGAGIIYAWDTGKMAADLILNRINCSEYEKRINKIYRRFFSRRLEKRKIMEENWKDLKMAIENSWIAFTRE